MRTTPVGTYFQPMGGIEYTAFKNAAEHFVRGFAPFSTLWLSSFFLARSRRLPVMKREAIGAFGPLSQVAAYIIGMPAQPHSARHIQSLITRLPLAALDAIDDLFANADDRSFLVEVLDAERMFRLGMLRTIWYVEYDIAARRAVVRARMKTPVVHA